MPWTSHDAKRHTKRATSPTKERQWAHVSNSMLKRGKSEGAAIRAANAVVKRNKGRSRRRSRR